VSLQFVSVIIPVFNDYERLVKCLAALRGQTYPRELYEVIVVDNSLGGRDLEGLPDQFPEIIVTQENKRGPAAARNKGLSMARGEIIAFTDSDCIPACDWIEKGVAKLQGVANCGLVGGRIKLFFKNPDKPTAVELYENVIAYRQKKYIEEDKSAITANLFTFKNVFKEVGDFDNSLVSYEDYDWSSRVCKAGYELVYADDAVVAHPARRNFRQLYRKIVWLTKGLIALEKRRPLSSNYIMKGLFRNAEKVSKDISGIFHNERLRGMAQKFKVVFVILFVCFIHLAARTVVSFRK